MSIIELNFQIDVYNMEIEDPKKEPLYVSYYFSEEVDSNMKFMDLIYKLVNEYGKRKENYFYIENDRELFWGQYFSDELLCYIDYDINFNPEKFNIKIGKLEQQFHITEHKIHLDVNGPGIGGDVGRENGIRFFFHPNEKDIHPDTPHIHVKKGEIEYRVNLKTKKAMDKVFKNRNDNKIVKKFINKHQKELLNYWNEVVINGESLKIKLTI